MKLREAFLFQSRACADLGSPFMGRLMALAAERLSGDGPIGRRLFGWSGDLSPRGASVPLRFGGALHALVLSGDKDLAQVYPPHDVDDDALWAAVERALTDHEADILAWLDNAPQTNEVRRSAAMIAAAHWLTARYGLPINLSELGASAGLNLMFDHFALEAGGARFGPADAGVVLAPDWTGPPPPKADLRINNRRGVDLNPLDPSAPEGQLRLRAYLWPDQTHRRALTDAAISVAAAEVDKADAIAWLATRLDPVPGHLHLIYHTIAWQYFPPAVQAEGEAMLARAGAVATANAPLARLAMEADDHGRGARLTLQVWPDGEIIPLGRIDFHGRWVDWQAPAPR